MKKIKVYSTGDEIPEGAQYLCTLIQTLRENFNGEYVPCWHELHYFLVE